MLFRSILERRRNTDLRISSENFVKEKSSSKLKKMLIQILISLIIYCGIYYIKNSQNENMKSFIANINSVLEYDVDFKKIYEEICIKCESLNFNVENNNENTQNISTDNIVENNEQIENNYEEIIQTNEANVDSENINKENEISTESELIGIGGSLEEQISEYKGDITEEEQMKIDAEYINENFNIIKFFRKKFYI